MASRPVRVPTRTGRRANPARQCGLARVFGAPVRVWRDSAGVRELLFPISKMARRKMSRLGNNAEAEWIRPCTVTDGQARIADYAAALREMEGTQSFALMIYFECFF